MKKKAYGMFYHGPTEEEKNMKSKKRPYGVHYVQPSAEEKANPGKPHGMYYTQFKQTSQASTEDMATDNTATKRPYGMFYRQPEESESAQAKGVNYPKPSKSEMKRAGHPYGMFYRTNSPYGPNYNEMKAMQEARDELLTQAIQEVTQELHTISQKLDLLLKQAS